MKFYKIYVTYCQIRNTEVYRLLLTIKDQLIMLIYYAMLQCSFNLPTYYAQNYAQE